MLFKKKLTEKNLVGVWKHPILASWGSIEISGGKTTPSQSKPFQNYNIEIFTFRENGTFTFGEYTKSGPLYEGCGRWALSYDKTSIIFTYDNGETNRIDIREFNGDSFITTSIQGNDFKFTKE